MKPMRFFPATLSFLFLLFISKVLGCTNDQAYTFGSFNRFQNTTITRTCSWITEEEESVNVRRSEWCEVTIDGKAVKDACALACLDCSPASAPSKSPMDSMSNVFRSKLLLITNLPSFSILITFR